MDLLAPRGDRFPHLSGRWRRELLESYLQGGRDRCIHNLKQNADLCRKPNTIARQIKNFTLPFTKDKSGPVIATAIQCHDKDRTTEIKLTGSEPSQSLHLQ